MSNIKVLVKADISKSNEVIGKPILLEVKTIYGDTVKYFMSKEEATSIGLRLIVKGIE